MTFCADFCFVIVAFFSNSLFYLSKKLFCGENEKQMPLLCHWLSKLFLRALELCFSIFLSLPRFFFIISWNLCWKKHCVTFQTQGTITPHTIVILPNTNGMHLLLCYDSKWLVCLFTVTCCPLLWFLQVFLFAMTVTDFSLCFSGKNWLFSFLWQKLVCFYCSEKTVLCLFAVYNCFDGLNIVL